MRLRWLLGNFADPQYRLPPSAEREVSNAAHEEHMPGGRFFWWTLLAIVLPVLVLAQFVLPWVLGRLGYAGQTGPYVLGLAALVLLVWPLSAWVYGHLYVKPVRKAMRELGFEPCVNCGYLLNELPAEVERCPECGHRR